MPACCQSHNLLCTSSAGTQKLLLWACCSYMPMHAAILINIGANSACLHVSFSSTGWRQEQLTSTSMQLRKVHCYPNQASMHG